MQKFDGFIAAIAEGFNLTFHKSGEGAYTTGVEFDNGHVQEVLVTLAWDEADDRQIHYYSVVAGIKKDSVELFKYALIINSTLDYGALALLDDTLILRNTILLEECDPLRFIKSLTYIAAKADELTEQLVDKE